MNPYQRGFNPYKKQAVNYNKNAIAESQDQGKMILSLYENAILFLSRATHKIQLGDVEGSHTCLVRAKSIVSELQATLNVEKGGEIAKNLKSVYLYLYELLIAANISKDITNIEHATKLLKILHEGWLNIIKPKNTGIQNPAGSYGQRQERLSMNV